MVLLMSEPTTALLLNLLLVTWNVCYVMEEDLQSSSVPVDETLLFTTEFCR